MKTTPCKSCGVPLVFAKNTEGKTVPLDARAPVYQIEVNDDGSVTECRKMDRTFLVSHFSTCPQASTHSKTAKAKGAQ